MHEEQGSKIALGMMIASINGIDTTRMPCKEVRDLFGLPHPNINLTLALTLTPDPDSNPDPDDDPNGAIPEKHSKFS